MILRLDVRRLIDQELLQLGGAHLDPRILVEAVRDALLFGRKNTALDSDMFVKVNWSVANMMAPANAKPNESPNDPPAEFTPAASLTRSSSIGDRV